MRGRIMNAIGSGSLAAILAIMAPFAGYCAEEGLQSKSDQSCVKCHQDYVKLPNILAGKFTECSEKAKSLLLTVDKDKEVIFFDEKTVLKNAPSFKEIPKNESVKIAYYKRDGKNFAKEVVVKKGIDVPKDQLASVEDVTKLVELGPEKGKYVLLDSRPVNLFNESHLPTAVAMPFGAFDELAEKVLPKEKDVLQIYYCAGFS